MRLPSFLPLAVLLGACAPSAPSVPAMRPTAVDLPPDVAGSSPPIGEPLKQWCYEVGDAPSRIRPRCEPSPERCDTALAKARRDGLADGFGDPFSECRPMRKDDFTRPRRLSGKAPLYSQEQREAGGGGAAIARCTLTVEGNLVNCQIIKSMPLMDQAILDAMATWRFEPMRFMGRPVSTTFTIPFHFAP